MAAISTSEELTTSTRLPATGGRRIAVTSPNATDGRLPRTCSSSPSAAAIPSSARPRVVAGDAVGQRRRGGMQVLRLDEHLPDAAESFVQFREMDAAPEVVHFHREVGVLHLPGNGVLQAAMKAHGGVDVQLGVGQEGRAKERETLNVIPMGMPDEEVKAERLRLGLQEVMAQLPDAGPAVQDDDRAVIGADFHACGVPAKFGGLFSRHGDGPAGPPEADEQGSSSFLLSGGSGGCRRLKNGNRIASPSGESRGKFPRKSCAMIVRFGISRRRLRTLLWHPKTNSSSPARARTTSKTSRCGSRTTR